MANSNNPRTANQAKAAEANATNNTAPQMNVTPEQSMQVVRAAVEVYGAMSGKLIASLVATFFAYAYPADKKMFRKADDVEQFLMKELNALKLKRSSVYAYIRTARTVATRLLSKDYSEHHSSIMKQDNPQKLADTIFGILATVTKTDKPSSDAISLWLDPKAKASRARNTGRGSGGANNGPVNVKANRIAPRLTDDKASEVVAAIPEKARDKFAATAATVIGRVRMATAIVNQMDIDECAELRTVIEARINMLAKSGSNEATPAPEGRARRRANG